MSGRRATSARGRAPDAAHGFNGANGREREWTHDEALDAGRRWIATYGEPPTGRDLNPALLRLAITKARERLEALQERERRFEPGVMCGIEVVRRLFGGMPEYLRSLGCTPRSVGRTPLHVVAAHVVEAAAVIERLTDGHRQVLDLLRRSGPVEVTELRYQRGKHHGFLPHVIDDDLAELEASGLIEHREVVKHVYRLTDAGAQALAEAACRRDPQ